MFESQQKLCPCCGEELAPGLFERVVSAGVPSVVPSLISEGQSIVPINDSLMVSGGRVWLRVQMTFPLNWDESPLQSYTWIEVTPTIGLTLLNHYDDPEFEGIVVGVFAADVKGFPGSAGATAVAAISGWEIPARIFETSEIRIAHFDQRDHHVLTDLYRKMWGGKDVLPKVNMQLRSHVKTAWREFSGQDVFYRKMPPPPHLAGMSPPLELCVAPPVDTGEVAMVSTVGLSETQKNRTELICYVRDPEEKLIQQFADFCYIPLFNNTVEFSPPTLYAVENPIDSSERMRGWLVIEPWWVEGDGKLTSFGPGDINYLAAIPVTNDEASAAQKIGLKEFCNQLRDSGLDVTDIKRESCLVSSDQ